MSDSRTTPIRYFVSHSGEVKGPFDLDMIEAFVLSGHYPGDIQICAEGSNEWHKHSTSVPAAALPPRQDQRSVVVGPTGRIPRPVLVVGGILAIIVIAAIFSGNESNNSPHSSANGSPGQAQTVAASPTAPSLDAIFAEVDAQNARDKARASAEPVQSSTTPDGYGASPTYYPVVASTPAGVLYTGADGHTYNVPNSDYNRLSRQKKILDEEDAVLTATQARLEAEENDIEAERSYLDRTNQNEIDDFNQKIDTLNARKSQIRQQLAAFNSSVDSFNAELHRVGTLVR